MYKYQFYLAIKQIASNKKLQSTKPNLGTKLNADSSIPQQTLQSVTNNTMIKPEINASGQTQQLETHNTMIKTKINDTAYAEIIQLKQDGNIHIKANNLSIARQKYTEALKKFYKYTEQKQEKQTQHNILQIQLYNNLFVVCNKQKQYKSSLQWIFAAITTGDRSVRCLIRLYNILRAIDTRYCIMGPMINKWIHQRSLSDDFTQFKKAIDTIAKQAAKYDVGEINIYIELDNLTNKAHGIFAGHDLTIVPAVGISFNGLCGGVVMNMIPNLMKDCSKICCSISLERMILETPETIELFLVPLDDMKNKKIKEKIHEMIWLLSTNC